MSKGSRPRPYSVSQDQFLSNWDAIFGKKEKEEDKIIEEVSKLIAEETLQATEPKAEDNK